MVRLSVLFLFFLGIRSSTAPSPPIHGYFYLVKDEMSQTEAQNICRINYTDLVTIYSEEDNAKLVKMLNEVGAKGAWIGLYRGEAKEKWSNGDPVIYKTLTGDTGTLDWCAAMKADGTWEKLQCTERKDFICYKQDGSSQTPTYYANLVKDTWYKAQSYCRKEYTDLVSINSQMHNKIVHEKATNKGTDGFWIGLYEEKWHWADGGNSDYRNWGSAKQSVDCVQLKKTTTWHLASCDEKSFALCYSTFIHVSDEVLDWEKASDYCNQENRAGLMIINSRAYQNDVETELRKRNISEPVWVGLKQSQLFGFWIWANRTAVFPYSNWDEGKQPEYLFSERCGAVVPQKGFQWKDQNCQVKYRVLCHIKGSV